MAQIRPAMMTKVVTGAVIAAVAGYSAVFLLELLRLAQALNSVQNFFSSAVTLMYLSVEGLFLCIVVAAGYWALRRKA